MQIVLMTHSSDSEFDGDCAYALVDATPALLEQIAGRVRLAEQTCQQDDDLHELSFWGSTAEFYDHTLLDACEAAVAAATRGGEADQVVRDWIAALERRG